jgi:hypothetical protein
MTLKDYGVRTVTPIIDVIMELMHKRFIRIDSDVGVVILAVKGIFTDW